MPGVDRKCVTHHLACDCRERLVRQAIKDLTEKVRLYHDKYGSEYIGGRPFQFILKDLKELGIEV